MSERQSLVNRTPFNFSLAKPYYHNLSDRVPCIGNHDLYKCGTAYQYDMHYGLEFGIVLQGKMEIMYPDLTLYLSPGDIWFCGMWEPHGWSTKRSFCESVNIIIWPVLAYLNLNELTQFNWLAAFTVPPSQRPQTNNTFREAMLALGTRIKTLLEDKDERTWLWLQLFVMEGILLATKQWPGGGRSNPVRTDFAYRLNQVLNQFFDNCGQMTTAKAATICGMNRNTFSLMFQRHMGLSFSDFALRYRLQSAATSLRQSDKPIKSISTSWGFTDTSHFDRMFHRHYGCTPKQYRQNIQSGQFLEKPEAAH